jgi:hypothetical protein
MRFLDELGVSAERVGQRRRNASRRDDSMEAGGRVVGANCSADERTQAADATGLLQVRSILKRFGGTEH